MKDILLSQWVIYDHPKDYPDHFVLRRWNVYTDSSFGPSDEMDVANTLEEIRLRVPPGLFCLTRFTNDDPCIVEVWV